MKKKRQITPMNYLKKILLGFDPAISCILLLRSTTCAISEVTMNHLNVIYEQVLNRDEF